MPGRALRQNDTGKANGDVTVTSEASTVGERNGIRPFDYDAWRSAPPSTKWREAGLHWHGHLWRGSPEDYGNEGARRDLSTTLPPKVLADWLRKPAGTVKRVCFEPDQMLAWLREQWGEVRDQLGQEATGIDEDDRFGRADYGLRQGGIVCWGGWLHKQTFFHLAAVPTAQGCHQR